jgi:hypothetical protein
MNAGGRVGVELSVWLVSVPRLVVGSWFRGDCLWFCEAFKMAVGCLAGWLGHSLLCMIDF